LKERTKILLGVGALGVSLLTVYSMNQRKRKPNLIIKKSLPFGFNAMTVPPIGIFIRRDQVENGALLQHEVIHWNQYRRRGLLPYYLGYFSEMMKYGYDGMPMEYEARINENDYCRKFYTDAVRMGAAKTVYNPAFRK
jgi:hypothetical protein